MFHGASCHVIKKLAGRLLAQKSVQSSSEYIDVFEPEETDDEVKEGSLLFCRLNKSNLQVWSRNFERDSRKPSSRTNIEQSGSNTNVFGLERGKRIHEVLDDDLII